MSEKIKQIDIDNILVQKNKYENFLDIISHSCEKKIVVNENSNVNYIKLVDDFDTEYNLEAIVHENATLNIFILQNKSGKNNISVDFKDAKGSINLYGINILNGNNKVYNKIRTIHENESYSDIKFVNIIDDYSLVDIDMKTFVKKGARNSKAFQNSKTILLSDDATISATPHLEISIDELEASHGASVGELDNDALYYLRTRGINEKEAKSILLDALCYELIDHLDDEEIVEYLRGLIKE